MKVANFAKPLLLGVLMTLAALIAMAITPVRPLADAWNNESISEMLPDKIGEWRVDPSVVPVAVDPATVQTLVQTYSETVSKTYVNPRGRRIMLSVAYGRDQRGGGRAHYPEVCYPAQGFQVGRTTSGNLSLADTDLHFNRLVATHAARVEPITYWMMVGEKPVLNSLQHKAAILSYGLDGAIADGLLFRVSSVNPDADTANSEHGDFIRALYDNLKPRARLRFFGSPNQIKNT